MRSAFQRLLRADLAFAAILIGLVSLLVLPLPTWLLDLLLAANLAWAFTLLLIALYVPHPLRLSTFPAILLVATLFRLGLNVSSTRLILGEADAGRVIAAFGDFVVRGNYVVGAVVFLILTLIQFLVIAKGAERVAEVAARFTLDAMPGRQMAIDADLRAGAFGLDEARERRQRLQAESHLFGSLDGAMKFVKGDAIAGLLITLINVIGGLLVGITQQGMGAGEAATTYTLLTVGDGLVSQVPALLVTLSAGLLVTRVAAREDSTRDLGSDILEQLLAEPRVFAISATLLLALAAIPGLPAAPFGLLSLGSLVTWRMLLNRAREKERAARAAGNTPTEQRVPSQESLFEPLAPVVLELGVGLSRTFREGDQEEALQDEIALVRRGLHHRLGVRLPGVQVRFEVPSIPAAEARVRVWELEDLSFPVGAEECLVLAAPGEVLALGAHARPVPHPLTGAPAAAVAQTEAPLLEGAGLLVCSPARWLMLEAAARLEEHAAAFVGLAEVQGALDALEQTHAALVESVVPRPVSLARLTGVLRRLVEDGVSIRDLRAILEALAAEAREDHDVIELTELARVGLGRQISRAHAREGALPAWIVDSSVEETVRAAIRRDGDRPLLALTPSETERLLHTFRQTLPRQMGEAVVLAAQDVRRYLQQLLRLEHPGVRVLGLREVGSHLPITALGLVAFQAGSGMSTPPPPLARPAA